MDLSPKKLDELCKACKNGYLHQYNEDPEGTHRCGRCGEVKAEPKPATTRKAS